MRLHDLDKILSAMLHTHPGISDLNFSAGHPPQVESFGELKPALIDPPIDILTPFQTERIALALMQGDRRLMYDYLSGGSCDLSYSLSDEARFRVNIFRQRGNFAVVLRRLEATVPTLETLHLPGIFREIVKEKTGLVLVTGATGSGKTTTLAAMLNEINATKAVHIVTLEDPIEFVHPFLKGTFNQRELGQDFNNYPNGLRAALRQAPKVILVGEMRDRATVEIALMAAETGHLVLSTLHTVDAGQSINRIRGMFTLGEEQQLRVRLSDVLRYVISQRLAPRVGGGRQLLSEIMGNSLRTKKAIVPQLIETKYKVHLGATEEDVLSKLRAHSYDIVVIYENFKGTALGTNPILREMIHRPGAQRRDHFVVLLTHRLASNDAMSA